MSTTIIDDGYSATDNGKPIIRQMDGTYIELNIDLAKGTPIPPGPYEYKVVELTTDNTTRLIEKIPVVPKTGMGGGKGKTISLDSIKVKAVRDYMSIAFNDPSAHLQYFKEHEKEINNLKVPSAHDVEFDGAKSQGLTSLINQRFIWIHYVKETFGLADEDISSMCCFNIVRGFTRYNPCRIKLKKGGAITLDYIDIFPKFHTPQGKRGISGMVMRYHTMLLNKEKRINLPSYMDKYKMDTDAWSKVVNGYYDILADEPKARKMLIKKYEKYSNQSKNSDDLLSEMSKTKANQIREILISGKVANPFVKYDFAWYEKLELYPGAEHDLSIYKSVEEKKCVLAVMLHQTAVHGNSFVYRKLGNTDEQDKKIREKDPDFKPPNRLTQMKNIAQKMIKVAYGQQISFNSSAEAENYVRFLPDTKTYRETAPTVGAKLSAMIMGSKKKKKEEEEEE